MGTAAVVAGVLRLEAKADLLPDAKLDAIGAYKKEGPIAMVGDGINGAPANALRLLQSSGSRCRD